MKVIDLRGAAREAVAGRPDRPATAVVADVSELRLVVFRLEPGQEVAPHHSTSVVALTVIEGSGTFLGADGERELAVGQTALYAPRETHGIRAGAERLIFVAAIAPRP